MSSLAIGLANRNREIIYIDQSLFSMNHGDVYIYLFRIDSNVKLSSIHARYYNTSTFINLPMCSSLR